MPKRAQKKQACKLPKSVPQEVIFVIVYRHRHGADAWARRTEEQATESVAETIRRWLDDELEGKDATKKKIRRLLKLGDVNSVRDAWELWEMHTDEYFDVFPRSIDAAQPRRENERVPVAST